MNVRRVSTTCFIWLALRLLISPLSGSAQQISKPEIRAQLYPHISYTANHTSFQQSEQKLPAVKAGDLIGQAFSGILMGGVSAFAAGIIVTQLSGCSGWCELGEFFIGASVGYIGGSSLMIHSYKNNSEQKGSYAAVLLGDMLGFGLGGLTLNALAESDTKAGRILGGVAFFTFPVGGAMAGYFLTRQPKNSYQANSLINVSSNKARLSLPTVNLTKVNLFRPQPSPIISLVNIQL